jgi:hypothetical protein
VNAAYADILSLCQLATVLTHLYFEKKCLRIYFVVRDVLLNKEAYAGRLLLGGGQTNMLFIRIDRQELCIRDLIKLRCS